MADLSRLHADQVRTAAQRPVALHCSEMNAAFTQVHFGHSCRDDASSWRNLICAGDREAPAQAVAAAVGIPSDAVHAGVKPAGKAELVQQLQKQGHCVAMVGDGINDAGALAEVSKLSSCLRPAVHIHNSERFLMETGGRLLDGLNAVQCFTMKKPQSVLTGRVAWTH